MNKYFLLFLTISICFRGAFSQELQGAPVVSDTPAASSLLPYGPTDSAYEEKKLFESSPFDQSNPIKLFLVLLISGYQNTFSKLDGSSCQFRPSCSHFGAAAIKRYGPLVGTLMTGDRLLRCNPYTRGLYRKAPDHYHNLDQMEEHAP
jgi:putative membrane protein insertion efficiency factor